MVARIDLAARSVTCSVHDLLPEAVARSLGVPGEGLSRLSVGAELHRVVQGRRQSERREYVPEVSVDTTLEIDGWTLRVLGRADGVDRGGDGRATIEEIKTLHFRSELHAPHAHERIERYRWQARIYALCLYPDGQRGGPAPLVDLGGETSTSRRWQWSPAQCWRTCATRLHTLVAAEREREALRARWRAAAAVLEFPFPEPCGRCSARRWRRSRTRSPQGGTCCSPPRPASARPRRRCSRPCGRRCSAAGGWSS